MYCRKLLAVTLQAVLVFLASAPLLLSQTRPKPPKSVRLYVFDNGVIKGLDPATFHFKKEELATTDMVLCSYLVVHPKGTLMWDSGAIPDAGTVYGDPNAEIAVGSCGLHTEGHHLFRPIALPRRSHSERQRLCWLDLAGPAA